MCLEVAIDISSESQRLLSTVDFAELRCRAQRASHLADSALSKAAANVTRSDLADLADDVVNLLSFFSRFLGFLLLGFTAWIY